MTDSNSRGAWDALLLATVAAMAVTFSQFEQRALAADDGDAQGRIVTISPNGTPIEQQAQDQTGKSTDEQPAYWLGIQGGPIDSDVLRTHLQLAGDVGIVVMDVVSGSPAEKAGLRKHDIVIAVGGESVTDMAVLQKAVAASDGKPVELKLIRLAKETTLSVTPEKRPANLQIPSPNGPMQGNFNFNMPMGQLNEALKQFQGPGGVRIFGPGMVFNGQAFDVSKLPNGVALSITRDNNGPTKVTVTKGGQTWTVEGNDEEALKKLPDDVRPYVEQMLKQQGGGMPFQGFNFGNMQNAPGQLGFFDFQGPRQQAEGGARQRAGEARDRLQQRMEEMEKRLEEMQERLEKELPADKAPKADDPSKT